MRSKESNSQPEVKTSEEFSQKRKKPCPNCGHEIDFEKVETSNANQNEFQVSAQEFPQALGHSAGRHYL